MAIQRLLGSDIAMAFDECPPAGVDRPVEAAVRRTRWAERCRAARRRRGQLGFGIVQGGIDLDLRRRSAEQIVALGFDGYAIGGLSVGESREAMLATHAATAAMLPAEPAALPHGGRATRSGVIEAIARGVDMFDCVLPTRLGRTGSALVPGGRINLETPRSPPTSGRSTRAARARPAAVLRAYIRH